MNEMMVELFKHNTWANLKLIEFCRALPAETRDSDFRIDGTYGAIKPTLVHYIGSQDHYLRTYGREVPMTPNEATMNWDDLHEWARKSSEAYEKWTAEAPVDQILSADFGPTTWTAPTWLIITQMINHNTEHRGHVGTVLAHMGIESPPLDLWAYGGDTGHITTKPKA